MKGLLCAESLNLNLVKIQVTGCWCLQANTCVFSHIATVRIPAPLGGGVQKVFYFLCFKKASFKGIYTLNGLHMLFLFNIKFKLESHSL